MSGLTEPGIAFETEASSGIGVIVEAAKATSTGGILSISSLELRNTRQVGAVTLIVQAAFVADDGEEFVSSMKIDSWDRDKAFAGPGTRVTVPSTLAVKTPRLKAITLVPVFVQYEDGSVESLDPSLASCLSRERRAYLERLAELRAIHRSQGADGVATAIREGKARNGWLAYQLGTQGVDAVIRDLHQPRRLAP